MTAAVSFVFATIAMPIVTYGQMPHLHRVRLQLLSRRRSRRHYFGTAPLPWLLGGAVDGVRRRA